MSDFENANALLLDPNFSDKTAKNRIIYFLLRARLELEQSE
jgi:hypothetical protein